ncbi:SDR family NAD(P)-dependent oxidoreductase, partial [Xanthovirga aplysinae]|uniref:SDR family NAD(P)-dependent oxidoreductase n=1 Tax=Xanthovirga aplysinae TaxID=2529853 RepID=UPI0012BB86B0
MILVTGANGLLGSFICRKLLNEGQEFKALKRASSDLKLLQEIKHLIHWETADLADSTALYQVLEGVDVVFHCAAMVSFDRRDSKAMYHINVEGTKTLVDTCLERGVQKFVHISSIAAIGKGEKEDSIVNEGTQWVNSEASTSYAKTKHLAELEVWRGEMEGLKTIIVNPSVILGPGDWNKSSCRIFKYLWEEKPYYTDGDLNYVDVRDVADMLYQLYLSGTHGERYILNAGRVSFSDLFNRISQNFEKRTPKIKVGKSLIRMAISFERLRSFLTRSKPLIPEESKQFSGKKPNYDNTKI